MTVSARELHEKLEIKTSFKDWFPRMCEYGFEEGTDFCSKMSESTGGRPSKDADITIDMAKQICMIQRSEIGKRIRQYFIDLEKAWNTPEQVMARALKLADKTIASLQLTISEQKPLVEFATHVSQTADTVDMGQMAKLAKDEGIKIGRNRLIDWMKQKKLLMPNGNPYQRYVDAGYMKLVDVPKKTSYGVMNFTKTVFTGKGQIWIIEQLREGYGKEGSACAAM